MTLGRALELVDGPAWEARGALLKQSVDLMEQCRWFSLAPQDDLIEWMDILEDMGVEDREKELISELCLLNGLWGYMEAYRIMAHITKDSHRSFRNASNWTSAAIDEAWQAMDFPADWEGNKQRFKERYQDFPHWTSGTSWGRR